MKVLTGNMITLTLVTGDIIHLVRQHIVSVRENNADNVSGSIVRMSNGDQWAVDEEPDEIVSGWNILR